MNSPTLQFLFPLERQFLKLHAYSQSCKTRLSTESLLFAFSWRGAPWNVQACVLSSNPAVRLTFCMCTLAVCKGSHLPPMHREPATGMVGEACRTLGMTMDYLGTSAGKMSPAAHRWLSYLSMSLWWVPSSDCYAPSISQPLKHADHLSILGGSGEKGISLETSCTAGEARYSITMLSISPMEEILGQWDLSWHWAVPPWGRSDIGKVKLFFIPPSMHFLLQKLCWNSQTPTKVFLSVGDCQNQCSMEGRQ